MIPHVEQRLLNRYAFAVFAIVIATAIRFLLDPWLGTSYRTVTYILAIPAVAWIGGFGPTILAIPLSIACYSFFLLDPRYTLWFPRGENTGGLLIYVFLCVLIALIGGSARTARRQATQRRLEAQEGQVQLEASLSQLARVDSERANLLGQRAELIQTAVDQAITLNHMFEQSPVGLVLTDLGFRIQRINAKAADFFGSDAVELLGQSAVASLAENKGILSEDALEQQLRKTLASGESFHVRGRARGTIDLKGEPRFWDWSIHRIEHPGGKPVGLLLTVIEVTNQLERERSLHAIEARLRVTLSSIGEAVVSSDRTGRIEYMNPTAESLTGWTLAEALGKRAIDVVQIWEQERQLDLSMMVDRRQSGSPVHEDRSPHVVAHDGSSVPIDFTASPIQQAGEKLSGVVLVFRDIRAILYDQFALRESEARLRELADSMPQIVWAAKPDGTIEYINARWQEYSGLSIDLSRMPDFWKELVHPDELQPFSQERQRVLNNDLPLEAEVRIRSIDGTYRWHLLRSVPILDDEGRVVRRFGTATDIHDRIMAEAAEKAAERKLRELAELMPQIVWISTEDSRSTYLNSRWYDYIGVSSDDPRSTTSMIERIHPDDRPRVEENARQSLSNRTHLDAEYRLLDCHGNYRWFLERSMPIFDESGNVVARMGTATDIDESKKSAADARFLAEAGTILAGIVDVDSTLRSVARLAVRYFSDWCAIDLVEKQQLRRVLMTHSIPEQAALAEGLVDRCPKRPEERGIVARVLETGEPLLVSEIDDAFLKEVAWNDEHFRLLQQSHLCSYLCVPLKSRSGPIGLLTFVTDVSQRRFGTRELHLAQDLAHRATIALENSRLYEELRLNDERKNIFLATLAHELRNPLSPISNSLFLLEDNNAENESQRETISMMKRQLRHLGRLVDDLMDMARINQGKVELRLESIDVRSLIDRSLETSRPALDDRGHVLEVSIPSKPVMVEADPTRLGQVLDNLLNNAIKYTDPEGRIRVGVRVENDSAVIQVRDNGIGMNQETLSHVFELFVQGERRTDRSQGGLGIGLSLVRRLVELHGGTVLALSQGLGQGSEFLVRLPLKLEDQPETLSGSSSPSPKPKALPRARRILVVDDNVDAARSMSLLLKRSWGQLVETAFDGPAALLAAESFRPDVILLDIGLPGMSGYEVARRIKARPEFKNTPIIAMTGWGQEEDRQKSMSAGFAYHLVKPIELEELRLLLGRLDHEQNYPRDPNE